MSNEYQNYAMQVLSEQEYIEQLAHADFFIDELVVENERLHEENARLKRGASRPVPCSFRL